MDASSDSDGEDAKNWLLRLIDDCIASSWADAQARAARLRHQYPAASDDDLANELIANSSFWAGVVGVGLGAVETIPGLGQYIALGSVLPELAYLTRLQFDVALSLAAIYDQSIPTEMLRPALLGCLAYSLGHEFVKDIAKEAGVRLSRRAIESVLKGATLRTGKRIAKEMGVHVTKTGLLKAIPLVAIPVNSALNYAGLDLFGRMAKHYFSPTWIMCGECGQLQPRRNKFCSSCATKF